jgi:hypothetical protein
MLAQVHQVYDFFTWGRGDAFCSYLPTAVKKVGLWDERFCNIGYHEADYFLRALMYNKLASSINDREVHGRPLNEVDCPVTSRIDFGNRMGYHLESMKYHSVSLAVFTHKYGSGLAPEQWSGELVENPPLRPLQPSYLSYPYFEKGVDGLAEKGYITGPEPLR